jgi:hypothetical protein
MSTREFRKYDLRRSDNKIWAVQCVHIVLYTVGFTNKLHKSSNK